MDPGAPAPGVLCQNSAHGSYVKQCLFRGGLTYTVLYYTVVLVDRHGDQGRHVLRHVRGQNRGSTLSGGGEFKLAFMGSKVYS